MRKCHFLLAIVGISLLNVPGSLGRLGVNSTPRSPVPSTLTNSLITTDNPGPSTPCSSLSYEQHYNCCESCLRLGRPLPGMMCSGCERDDLYLEIYSAGMPCYRRYPLTPTGKNLGSKRVQTEDETCGFSSKSLAIIAAVAGVLLLLSVLTNMILVVLLNRSKRIRKYSLDSQGSSDCSSGAYYASQSSFVPQPVEQHESFREFVQKSTVTKTPDAVTKVKIGYQYESTVDPLQPVL